MSNIRFRAPHANYLSRHRNSLLVVFFALFCFAPLLLTPVLPLVDFYAHILRFQILAQPGQGSIFGENYIPAWKLLPNLGLDVVGTGLMHVLPPLTVAKVTAALIIFAPFAGTLYLARVLHGHLSPVSVVLAGLLTFNNILVWGFANFLFGIGIAVGGLGYWIAASDRPARQLFISSLIGIVLLFVHALSFAIWGLMLGAIDLMLAFEVGRPSLRSLALRAGRLLSLALVPSALFLMMDTAKTERGVTEAFSNLRGYAERGQFIDRVRDELLHRIDSLLRVAESFSPPLDRALGLMLWGIIMVGLITGVMRLDRRIWLAAGMMFVFVLSMPPNLFGVGHVDERMPLVLLMLITAGLVLNQTLWRAHVLLWCLTGLFAARMAIMNWEYHKAGVVYRDYLNQIEHIDTGRIAAPLFLSEPNDRNILKRICKPLSFLLAIRNGTAVPTFANPTQQPLIISGPLSEARLHLRSLAETVSLHAQENELSQKQQAIELFFEAGFDSVVVCDETPTVPAPTGARILARGHPWTIYGKRSSLPK